VIQGERLLRGSGIAQQVIVTEDWKPYRWGGRPGWDPAQLGPLPTPAQERQAKHAEFARLRSGGLGVGAAAVAMGLTAESGRWYEAERKRRAAGAS
jgi:hypothetical protein